MEELKLFEVRRTTDDKIITFYAIRSGNKLVRPFVNVTEKSSHSQEKTLPENLKGYFFDGKSFEKQGTGKYIFTVPSFPEIELKLSLKNLAW